VSGRLEWGEASERYVATVEELDRSLDELEASASEDPLLVELFRDDGASLSLGLGRSLTVLDYVPADLDPPYFRTHSPGTSGESMWFRFRGDLSEYPPDAAVPLEAGRRALRHFYETGERSPELAWRET
jgi:Immunity protein Imm1